MKKRSLALTNRIVFVLSLIGIGIAFYILQAYLRQSAILCLNSGCEVVRNSQYSYIFGIPVPALGLFGYAFLAVLSFMRSMTESRKLSLALIITSALGFLLVLWFTYAEIFLIKAICMWCALSTINMTAIFLIILWSRRYEVHG